MPEKQRLQTPKRRISYIERNFLNPAFKELESKGANRQRPLWASTSTKNPAYSDVLYVEELIGRKYCQYYATADFRCFSGSWKCRRADYQWVKRSARTFTKLESISASRWKK